MIRPGKRVRLKKSMFRDKQVGVVTYVYTNGLADVRWVRGADGSKLFSRAGNYTYRITNLEVVS